MTETAVEAYVDAMSRMTGQVSIVTSGDEVGVWAGITATAVCSLSAEPPTLVACVNQATYLSSLIRRTGNFSVNLLSSAHRLTAEVFAGMTPRAGADRFQVGDWFVGATGAPALTGALARFDCVVEGMFTCGSHLLLIGGVRGTDRGRADGAPLVYFSRQFAQLSTGAPTEDESVARAGAWPEMEGATQWSS